MKKVYLFLIVASGATGPGLRAQEAKAVPAARGAPMLPSRHNP